MLKKIYFSPFGILISIVLRLLAMVHKPFMVYGFYNQKNKKYLKKIRIGSTVKLINKRSIDLSDNIWIGHYSLIDGIGGVTIGKGVHISSHTVIYSHSSQDAIRLLGDNYIMEDTKKRIGYKLKSVTIGDYTFIGTSSIVLPGSNIGRGCIIGAGSVIRGNIPDYSIASGNPIQIIGDTRERDKKYFLDIIDESKYYDPTVLKIKR
ncbi:MAG: acyltransferase [Bacteroidetes bacterium]|nr:acyltransferase [Bacteroidota bacterium]